MTLERYAWGDSANASQVDPESHPESKEQCPKDNKGVTQKH